MIDRDALLDDLKRLVKRLESDLRDRCREVPEIEKKLEEDHRAALAAKRTGKTFEEWRADEITQVAVAWVLSSVFVRFLEDNRLVDPPRIAGPVAAQAGGENRLGRARDEHEIYIRRHPAHSDREYLLWIFEDAGKLPGAREVFGRHNPTHEHEAWLSGDASKAILELFRRLEPATGHLVHDFTDPSWSTRFLGDLYQDLSESARQTYALLQTPEFVEEFILERTLEPAIEEFGLEGFRMIDPACGSGHFLLGAFRRILGRWQRKAPAETPLELVNRTLASLHGVDLNPYAIAIARFRLLLEALRAAGIERIERAPAFGIQLACGDSLYHGSPAHDMDDMFPETDPHAYVYFPEDLSLLRSFLRPGQYHAVVANPPYITPKDPVLNQQYRDRYKACHRQYSLGVPFLERIFNLAVEGGYTGQITANSFMKREFGKKLIEQVLSNLDLTHVIDTSGAYIPGHGTPTVILFGRKRKRVGPTIRAVMGIRGEPQTPDDPARGLVWTSIAQLVDAPGEQSEFVSVADVPRERFEKHPWSIGGGGAAELKERIERSCQKRLDDFIEKPIGRAVRIAEEDVFIFPKARKQHSRCPAADFRRYQIGEGVRDWSCVAEDWVWYPYSTPEPSPAILCELWPWRTTLANRATFQGLMRDAGLQWYEYMQHTASAYRTPLSIVFAFVATHNHFALDRGGKVFNRSAPVIKLPPDATEEDHLALLGLLNSSTACFWMKQACHNKGATSNRGVLQADPEKFRFEFDGTKLQELPIPKLSSEQKRVLIAVSQALDDRVQRLAGLRHDDFLTACIENGGRLRDGIVRLQQERESLRQHMVRLQEELDWLCYEFFGLLSHDSPSRSRAWKQPVDSLPPLEADDRPYRTNGSSDSIDRTRVGTIAVDPLIALIERPDFKRRWFRSAGAYDERNLDDGMLLARGLQSWLLDRLESTFDHDGRMNDEAKPTAQVEKALVSTARLADLAARDPQFLKVAEVYRGRPDFDVAALVAELVEEDSVPLLPALRYTAAGLEKRAAWERTWALQREEDAIDARAKLPKSDPAGISEDAAAALKKSQLGDIPVPPKYQPKDFRKGSFWRLRGKLDVPKERWISFPGCERDDRSAVVAWAGLDHLEMAKAISAYFVEVQERLGGRDDKRLPLLLACLHELVPWLKQWHNDPSADFDGIRMGDYFDDFITSESRKLNLSPADLAAIATSTAGAASASAKPRRGRRQPERPSSPRAAASPSSDNACALDEETSA